MTEPRELASSVRKIAPGVWTWQIHNAAIGGGISSSSAVADGNGGCVLIDPVRLTAAALRQLPPVHSVVLTARTHQRAAWRFRDVDGAAVWMPRDSSGAEQEPDHWFTGGDQLPAGLEAIHTPGPEEPHYCLLHPGSATLFVSDLVTPDEGGTLRIMPGAEHLHDDLDQTRASVDSLTHFSFERICLAHGAPVLHDAQRALEAALEDAPAEDGEHTTPDGPRRPIRDPQLTGAVHSRRHVAGANRASW